MPGDQKYAGKEDINSLLKDAVMGTRAHAWVPTSTVKAEIIEQDLAKAQKVLEAFEK
ncbi:MAG: hypothetical protein HWE07_06070 [Cytophagia bacterium]|nr:hypothetical protein [Cytophagia bacterium]